MRKSILIATMALDIGGAETFIVELSRQLAKSGHRVTVVSNGGIYVSELEKEGVRHIKVPLHTKNPASMLRSFARLKKIVIHNNIDVVHAHARIPAFICNRVCHKLNVPFVTTVHFKFRTSFLFRKFTRWGSYTNSVSKDINDYLIENYNYDESHTALTVNGINTEKFKPMAKDKAIMEELGLSNEDNVISTICRIDKGSSKTAFMLCDTAIDLSAKINNLKIIIVGEGNQFDHLKEEAAKVNKQAGRELMILTGRRSDISAILSVTDVFTGISRAALEAMATAKPVVLCGDFGYLGILDEESLPKAIETNLTCRSMAAPSNEKLTTDLILMFNDKTIRTRNADLNINTVKELYTVERMAKDALFMYDKAINDMAGPPVFYHAVMSGYYGFENSGDEALLASILRELREKKPDLRVLVLSKKPTETSQRYEVDSVARANPFSLAKGFSRTGLLIFGGGNLIQDLTSFQSIIYYTFLMNYAKARGLKVMLYANGIGPLIRKASLRIAARTLNKTDVITVREPNSAKMLEDIGVTGPKISITADPVISFRKPDAKMIENVRSRHSLPSNKTVVFSVRPWKGMEEKFTEIFAKIADYINEKYGLTAVFLPLNTKKDGKVSGEIASRMKTSAVQVENEKRAMNLVSIISGAEILIGMRLHSLIYASITETPFIGVVYDPKVRYFIDLMEQEDGGSIDSLSYNKVTVLVDTILENRNVYVEKLKTNKEKLRKLSSENAKQAISLMYGEANE